jgi:hypothetical protein
MRYKKSPIKSKHGVSGLSIVKLLKKHSKKIKRNRKTQMEDRKHGQNRGSGGLED